MVRWPLMGGLLHLVQQGRAWAGWGPAQSPPCCTKCNVPPINGQCTNFILFDVALFLDSKGLSACCAWISRIHMLFYLAFLSASLYVSKRGAYWNRLRLCRDVVGWLSRACTVAKRCILGSYYGTLIGNPAPGIQWYNFWPPGVTPNRGMGPPVRRFLSNYFDLLLTSLLAVTVSL